MGRSAKYTEVARKLQQRIAGGGFVAGEPLPSELDLAREYEINRLTLRKALELLEREDVVIRRHGCGTFVSSPKPARALCTILYIGETQSHFYSRFYEALCAEAQDRGRAVIAFRTEGGGTGDAQQLSKLVPGCQQVICQHGSWASVSRLIPEGLPVTLVSGFDSIDHLDKDLRPAYVVSTDTYRAVGLAVDQLVQLGHRRIAYVDYAIRPGDDPLLGPVRPNRLPYLGYRSALFRSDIADEYVIGIPDRQEAEFQESHFRSIMHYLRRSRTLPTAYICAADFRAGPTLRALREMGMRVPEDASVIGIGNTPWAQWLDTPLTSVCLGEADMARLALILTDEPEPPAARIVRIDPHLVERQTTGPTGAGQ